MADNRILRNARGDEARINLASAGRYAVALGGRIVQGSTVEDVQRQAAPLGWTPSFPLPNAKAVKSAGFRSKGSK